jgi:hypothetical protein
MHDEATTLIETIALKYYQPMQVLVKATLSGKEYVFVPKANISLAYVDPDDIDNLLGRKAGCNCGGSKRQQAFSYANESDIRRWKNGGGR